MPENTMSEAIAALKAGDKAKARTLLLSLLDDDPQNEDAWLLLSAAVDDPRRKRQCLETALDINPDNQVARRGLQRLQPPAEQAQQAAAQQAAAQQAAAPAPPGAADPQPAEPAPHAGDAPPLPTFEQTTAETDAEAALDAAAGAETPPPDPEAVAESADRRRQQRLVALIGIVVAVLLIIMIGLWIVIYLFFI